MKQLFLGILLISTLTIAMSAAAAETNIPIQVGPLHCTPITPAAKSTVTFQVNVTGAPTQVNLWYHECKPGMCYSDQNITMTKNNASSTLFEATVTFSHADATYVIAHVLINDMGNWSYADDVNITLTPPQNGNSGKKSPGFEVVPVIAAVAVALIILRKKRS